MQRFILALWLLLGLCGSAHAQGTPGSSTVVSVCGTPPSTYTPGQNKANLQDTSGRQCFTTTSISGTVTANQGTSGSAAWPVKIDQTTPGTTNAVSATNLPATVSTGTGAQGASSPRVTVAVDSATVAGSASLPAGGNVIGHVITDSGSVVSLPTGAATAANQLLNIVGITPTDRTITSATGSSQTVMALNNSRHSLIIQNTGSANCGVNPTGGTALIGGAGTLTLFPGGSYQPRVPTLSAVTAICGSTQPLYAEEN